MALRLETKSDSERKSEQCGRLCTLLYKPYFSVSSVWPGRFWHLCIQKLGWLVWTVNIDLHFLMENQEQGTMPLKTHIPSTYFLALWVPLSISIFFQWLWLCFSLVCLSHCELQMQVLFWGCFNDFWFFCNIHWEYNIFVADCFAFPMYTFFCVIILNKNILRQTLESIVYNIESLPNQTKPNWFKATIQW